MEQKVNLDVDLATLYRLRETLANQEDLNLFLKVERGREMYEDLVSIDKLITDKEGGDDGTGKTGRNGPNKGN